MPASQQVTWWVRDAVRAVLAGEPVPAGPTEVLDDVLVNEVVSQRVAGILAATGLRQGIDEPLRSVADGDRMAVLRQVRQMDTAARALDGLPWLSIKGPLLAVQTTGDFAARGYGDLDVVVSPDDVGEAHRRLVAAGWRPDGTFPQPGPSWGWRHMLRTYGELPLYGDRSVVDLHWALAPTRGRLPTFAEAWARREEIPLAGRSWSTISRGHALQHSCVHAATDSWRWLRSLVDIYRLASAQEAWTHIEDNLGLTELTTLRVVRDRIGLPEAVPGHVLAALAAVPERRLAGAEWGVAMLENNDAGNWTTQSLVARLKQSTSVPQALSAISCAILPAHALAEVRSERAVIAVPQALAQRGTAVVDRMRERWRGASAGA